MKQEFDATAEGVLTDYDQRKELRSLLKSVAFEPLLLSKALFGDLSLHATFLAIFRKLHEEMAHG
jgi:hypothetical protein